MFLRQLVPVVVIASMLTGWSLGQNSGQIVTRTRLVAVFSELQNQWMDAVRKKDPAALDRLLSDEHQVWIPSSPRPIPREEWQPQAFAANLQSYRVRDMAVRSVREDVAVESFVLNQSILRNGKAASESYFIVNVWTMANGNWRCTDSYVSPVTTSGSVQGHVKPTGKN